MNQNRTKRKLTAIFSADVVGYSRLMDKDEAWTIKNLDENKNLIGEFVNEYGGRVIDAIGDNLLAEFSSIINSVECAVKIQQELKKKNDTLVEDRRMHFRIGVNLGDVVEEGGRIYGSGVNIASRLEALAEPGGICISGRTYDHIKSKLCLGYKYLGEHNVKNISEPIRIYRLLMEYENAGKVIGEEKAPSRTSFRIAITAVIALIIIATGLTGWIIYHHQSYKIESASIEREPSPVASGEKEAPKTIAVLPFENLSPEKDQEYFADGIAEELLNSLTRISELEVRGRTSSFYFKGKKENLGTISKKLNVEYILEGSVRKADKQIRITVQLINTKKDAHLWSKTYERTMDDIFAIQDDIAQSVADALQITLGVGELGRRPGMTGNTAAYDAYLAGRSYSLLLERENIFHAIEQLEQAVALDPDFAICWNTLSLAYVSAANLWVVERAEEFQEKGKAALKRVIELLPDSDLALRIAASQSGDMLEVERLIKKALMFTPGDYETIFEYGAFLYTVGRSAEAINYFQRLVRMEPLDSMAHFLLGAAYEINGNIHTAGIEYIKGRELASQPFLYNASLLVLAMEENNRELIDEYMTLMENQESEFNQVILSILDTQEEAGAKLRPFLTDPALSNVNGRTAFAVHASYFGEHELALQSFESIRSELDMTGIVPIWRPIHKGMRQLPGFKDFVQEVGLVDYWRESGNWGDFCHPVSDDDFVCD